MNVEYINPFIEASQDVLVKMANLQVKIGKLFIRTSPYESDSVVIIIGITGSIRGQVIFSMEKSVAMHIASAMMCGMPVAELDDIARSAISELTNMILGNTATILADKGTFIEITTPSVLIGDKIMISNNKLKTICVPLVLSNGDVFEVDISVADNK